MLLLAALVATAAWSCGFAQEIPVQSPMSITKSKGSVRLQCNFKDVSEAFDTITIHWYQQKANRSPQRILYFSSGKVVDEGFQAYRYLVEKVSRQKLCILTINDIIPDDTATYYCAYWSSHRGQHVVLDLFKDFGLTKKTAIENLSPKERDLLQRALDTSCTTRSKSEIPDVLPAAEGQAFTLSPGADGEKNGIFFSNGIARGHVSLLQSQNIAWDAWIKYFGTGTKLIVSSKGNSPPAHFEILQKKHENQITYVCLIEKFYPEVIRVTWTDEAHKEVTDNVVQGDPWKATKEGEYSISSWLTASAANKDKNYHCKYEHESQGHSLPTQEFNKPPSQEEDCSTYPGNSTVFNGDHLMHRTAYLVYIVLLLKSSMYYLIILFFIYRRWAPTKHEGKKA